MMNKHDPNTLIHMGRLGQRWHHRKGPPYPLKYDDLSPEEKAEAKKKAVQEGNIKEAAANINHFTNQELQDIKNRYNLNAEIKNLSAKSIKTGMDKAEDLMNNINRINEMTKKGISAYNTVAKIANSLGDGSLKVISDQKPDSGISYVDTLKLKDGTTRTITVKNAKRSALQDTSGYNKPPIVELPKKKPKK